MDEMDEEESLAKLRKLELRNFINLAVREGLYNHRHFGDPPSAEVRERSVKELLNRGFHDDDYDSLDELDRRALAACTDVGSSHRC